MTVRVAGLLLGLAALAFGLRVSAQTARTLASVRARGYLLCGIDRSEAEYSSTDEHGSRIALDRQICKAIAVAALGADAPVKVTLYADDASSMKALGEGRADLIASLSSEIDHSASQQGFLSIAFTAPILYDPVSIMVKRSSGVRHASQLSGKLVCLLSETRTQDALQSWFSRNRLDLVPFPFQEEGEMEAAFVTDRCVGLAGDRTRLLETLRDTGSMAPEFDILPERFAKDTLGMAYRADDPAWGRVLSCTREVLFSGGTQPISKARENRSSEIDSLPNDCQVHARDLDLRHNWEEAVIQTVGSYREIFQQSFGSGTLFQPLIADRQSSNQLAQPRK